MRPQTAFPCIVRESRLLISAPLVESDSESYTTPVYEKSQMNQSVTSGMSSRKLYFRLLGYVRPYWGMLVLGLVLSAVAAAMEPFLPALMKPLLDHGFAAKSESGVGADLINYAPWAMPLVIVFVMTLRGILTFFAGYAMSRVQSSLISDIREQMFRHLVCLPMSFHEQNSSARTITRITADVNSIGAAATTVGVILVRESFALIGLLAWLLYLDWVLTVITLSVAPFIAMVNKKIGQRLRDLTRSTQNGNARMTQTLQEVVMCQKVVKVFGGEGYETRRFRRVNDQMQGYALRSAVAAAAGTPLVHFFISIVVAVVIYIALIQSARGEATVGSFVSFITGMLMLLGPIKALSGVNLPLQRGLAAAESVFELLDESPEADPGGRILERVAGSIQIDSVSFRYPRADVDALDNFSLNLKAGETIALVGASGSGKTTLAGLLPLFHRPTQGHILIDGIDVCDCTLSSLRAQFAIVSQETLLFDDTVAANISYGASTNVTQAKLELAAQAANALDFILALPEGFDTVIGENGGRLSGGQRQRLAIARAILKNAPILILDEATSALDNESERLVKGALDRLMKDRTTLVIAHRLSTIENADRIVVMENGCKIEEGRHEDLLAKDGLYARLHRVQLDEQQV